jgi:hypothetical protein
MIGNPRCKTTTARIFLSLYPYSLRINAYLCSKKCPSQTPQREELLNGK